MKSSRKGRPAGSAARPRLAIAPAVGNPPGRPSPSSRWGAAVDELLQERGWTQKELAARAGLRPNAITNLVRYGAPTTTTTLLA